jgi:tRNA U34 2-thiouridine synthase MnmA/TrmU
VRLRDARLHRPARAITHVRLRYHARALLCEARPIDHDQIELELAEPAEAVAPGQLACLMHDDCVVGEGTIA